MPLGLSREFVVQKGSNTPDGEHDVVVSARMMDTDLLWNRMEQIFENCTYVRMYPIKEARWFLLFLLRMIGSNAGKRNFFRSGKRSQ